MNTSPILQNRASGKLTIRQFRNGKLVTELKDVPNLILNGAINPRAYASNFSTFYLRSDVAPFAHEDLPGTWSQSGNTVTRTTGVGTFPSSPSQIGNELKWQDGERCHVTDRASDTSITVSGPARTITAKTIRRYPTNLTNGSTGANQTISTSTVDDNNQTTGVVTKTFSGTAPAATSAYTLTNVRIAQKSAIVVLPVPIAVEEFDQIQLTYTYQETWTGRAQRTLTISELFSGGGYPFEYSASAIVGNGTTFDVTATAHHFLAGDSVVLKEVIPLRKTITSITASGSAWTVTATAHGLSVSDTIVIAGCTIAGYNGTFTVASVPNANTITITNATSPGTASDGTVRLATPVTYFNGTFTVASVPNANTVRITSTITGPAVDPSSVLTSSNECTIAYFGSLANLAESGSAALALAAYSQANAIAVPLPASNQQTPPSSSNFSRNAYITGSQNAAFGNDWNLVANPPSTGSWGAGTSEPRVKQIYVAHQTDSGSSGSNTLSYVITFTTPQPKGAAYRLVYPNFKVQYLRELL